MPGMTEKPGANGGDKPIIITISGDLGSGKSLLANALVERWQAERYSTGVVQRKLAEKMGITTLELNRRAETDRSIDDQIDSVFKNLARTPTNLVVDSRMAFHFLPMSFRVKLEVPPAIAAARVGKDTGRIGEGDYRTQAEVEAALGARKASERARFKAYYNADIEDHAGYDLVINTADVPPEAVAQLVNDAVALWRRGVRVEKLWVAPRSLFPTIDPLLLDADAVIGAAANWPLPGGWPENAIPVRKAGSAYVAEGGAEWISAGIKGDKPLAPVVIQDGMGMMPDSGVTERWESTHHFKHLYHPD